MADSDLHICVNCMSALVNTSVRWGREFVCMVFDICMLCACTYDAIYARVSSALAYYVCVGGGGGRRDQPHSVMTMSYVSHSSNCSLSMMGQIVYFMGFYPM